MSSREDRYAEVRDRYALLCSLRVGDRVTVTQDGRELEYVVTVPLRRDPGGFGSWEHARVTVGLPGGYARELTADGLTPYPGHQRNLVVCRA